MEKFQKEFEICSYECDSNGELRLRSLFNLFQDMADNHASIIGVGYEYCTQHQLGWVGGAYHVQIDKMPVWKNKIILRTWPSRKTAVTAIREFEVIDAVTGLTMVRASSQWVLIDSVRHRPVSVLSHLEHCDAIDERKVNTDFRKLSAPEREDIKIPQIIRTDDIDLNCHVNNAVYPTWILDALPSEFMQTHELSEIQIQYKSAAKTGNTVLVIGQINDGTAIHSIMNEDATTEYARVHSIWNKIKET